MKTSTVVILGLVAAFCIIACTAAPECSSTERAKRDTKAEKPKADKPKADKGAVKKSEDDKSAAKKPEDDDDDEEPKPKYESKPGDKADVNDYKNKREANPGKDCKSKTTADATTVTQSDDTTASSA